MSLEDKERRLEELLRGMAPVVVAFSGGVDSAFLAYTAHRLLGQEALAVTAEINLHVPALLPATYVDDVHARLVLYKRLADCRTLEALEALREELIDRFGNLPEPARALIECHRLRVLGEPLGIARVDAAETAIQLQFVAKPPIEPAKVLKLVQQKKHYRLAGQDRLRIELKLPELRDRVSAVREAFGELA